MGTLLTIVSFIVRLVFGILDMLAAGYYVYMGVQLLSWKDKDKISIFYGIFSVLTAIIFACLGLFLIVSLFV